MNEYYAITQNARKPGTSFERILAMTNRNDWVVVILAYCPKHLVLVEEQLAICTFCPKLNRNRMVKFNYWLPRFDLEEAINLSEDYRSLFVENSFNYNCFTNLIKNFKNIQRVKTTSVTNIEEIRQLGVPVFVYDYSTGNIVAVYGSISHALTSLNISQDALYIGIRNNLIYTTPNGQILAISSTILTPDEVNKYVIKTKVTQIKYTVIITDKQGTVISEYESLRAFCNAHKISDRTLRRKMQIPGITEYKEFTLSFIPESRRIPVYCYDPNTKQRVGRYPSITAAYTTVSMRYADFQSLVRSNGIYNGRVYSFSDTYPL